jgi:3-dehydroquinate synthase
MKTKSKTRVVFLAELPSLNQLSKKSRSNFILIYDDLFLQSTKFVKWAEQFSYKFDLRAGEGLKNIDNLPLLIKKILPCCAGYSPDQNILVVVGGGTLGDVGGFLASIIKRGIGYINIPSTWLAAVDSAHGGKTGLNVDKFKNQVGSFYEPEKIYCVKSILTGFNDSESSSRFMVADKQLQSAFGEVIKMAILTGGKLMHALTRAKVFDAQLLWKLLPDLIKAKMSIVERDPRETKGVRQLLNLGHTMGHAYEIEKTLPHGIAVQMGLEFAAEWSLSCGFLKKNDHEQLKKIFSKNKLSPVSPISADRLYQFMKQDKKAMSGDSVRFVFINKPGRATVKKVNLEKLVAASTRLGWSE